MNNDQRKPPAFFDHREIEKKWQEKWEKESLYKTADTADKPKYYVLDMFPYPSGTGLHVGHPRGYIASDIFSRYKRMQGFNVLHPMGFDSFGLPAEQYAIKTGNHPGPHTDELVEHYKKQLSNIGFSYDWSREVMTHRPEYYKWTQWIFLQLYNAWYNTETNKAESIETCIAKLQKEDPEWGNYSEKEKQDILMKYRIAYEGYAEVNWCPELGTVLANDEVITAPDGTMVSERGEYPVYRKSMRQWFMRISAYADRLLSGLDTIDWPHSIKEIQRNWIGKSEGSEIEFKILTDEAFSQSSGLDADASPDTQKYSASEYCISVFTTRADTLFGVTYVVLAPEHALVEKLAPSIKNWDEVQKYIGQIKAISEDDRTNDKNEKTGICLEGVYAINPANGEQVPVWIANYVLASYGTGAVMAVPAHDERDFEFARKNKISILRVVDDLENKGHIPKEYHDSPFEFLNKTSAKDFCFTDYGILMNSGKFNGLTSEEAKKKITEFVGGRFVTKYKMRDAIFARQRYWGEPIPLRHTNDGIIAPLSETELPLTLPDLKDFAPAGDGNSALSKSKEWMEKGYETNTMPGWAGSSWYFLRYMDPHNDVVFASPEAVKYWGQVDMYVGGAEHATGHLLYSRFWNMALHDLGYVPHAEPFKALRNQGMIAGPDGRKMSKRWGNVINPDDVVAQLGADTLRVYESFMGPFEAHLPWSIDGIAGSRRFIERVYRLSKEYSFSEKTDVVLEKILHKTIKKVTEDIQSFSFNTAISAMMIFLNEYEKIKTISKEDFKTFLKLLAPFAPHITEELWNVFEEKGSIHLNSWPSHDESKIIDEDITIGIQINGKVRDEITISIHASKEEVEIQVLAREKVKKYLEGQTIKKIVVVPQKIVNIVI